MSQVLIKKASYNYAELRPIIFEMIDVLAPDLITPQARVLIKPNLLMAAPPERAVLTHPLIVKAVAEYVIEKGGKPSIADSPAAGKFAKIIEIGGYQAALKDLDVKIGPFETYVKTDIGEPFGKIEIARDAIEADVVINLAKLKTHAQMLLTLGVKNLFGCIIGLSKPEWHFRTGVDHEMFAKLLVQIYKKVNPSITLVDGILAMEGQGPAKSGTPRHLGVIAGSHDAVAVDWAICNMLDIDPERLHTIRAARYLGWDSLDIQVSGDSFKVTDFNLPQLGTVVFGPRLFQKWMRRHFIQKPVVEQSLCRLCGECWEYCPAKAITRREKQIEFDYDICIRCYCCIEVCPHGALKAVKGWAGELADRIYSKMVH
ncbi:DUF362 domain-containing protein [Desulfococcaceae bacterium HSG9]|nr:DUF362 domain-containing protein [Desulfococcaceae bacterium HSG9]